MDYRGVTLILHRSRRRCNEEKLRGGLLRRRGSARQSGRKRGYYHFSHGCGILSLLIPIAKLPGTVSGTFQSIPLHANVTENKAN
jgi:hypothetical protein